MPPLLFSLPLIFSVIFVLSYQKFGGDLLSLNIYNKTAFVL